MLQHDTGKIVKRFEINVMRCVLRSPKTVYDPIRVRVHSRATNLSRIAALKKGTY